MAFFWAIISFLNSIWEAVGLVINAVEDHRLKVQEEKRQAREEALTDLQNAQTEEEFDDAQERVVDSKP
jgi:hypothetical protein